MLTGRLQARRFYLAPGELGSQIKVALVECGLELLVPSGLGSRHALVEVARGYTPHEGGLGRWDRLCVALGGIVRPAAGRHHPGTRLAVDHLGLSFGLEHLILRLRRSTHRRRQLLLRDGQR
eukprot:scaffold273147_cov30-Tisochrysis_lutea.AAC.2